jgi:hypothetical protein
VEVGKNIAGINHEDYVSGLEASWFDPAIAYVALDGHRHDDWMPYIFKTTDYGSTWTSVSGNLPAFGNVNSVRQDPVNRNLLYAATETGFYISLNDGQSWSPFMPGLPTGRVDEVLVHPREHDLILATHSRSVWIMDDISALQAINSAPADTTLFKPRDAVLWKSDRRNMADAPGDKLWAADPAPRGTAITYFAKDALPDATIAIVDATTGQAAFSCRVDAPAGLQPGLHRIQWPMLSNQQVAGLARGRAGGGGAAGTQAPAGSTPCSSLNSPRAAAAAAGRGGAGNAIRPGSYKVTLTVGGKEIESQTFNVLEDIWLNE